MNGRNIIIALAMEFKGDWNSIYNAISSRNYGDILQKYGDVDLGNNIITMLDKDYPECLKKTYQPPFALFCEGNKDLLKSKDIVAILGTKSPSKEYIFFTNDFVNNLSKDKVIITTNTKGIADIAMTSAIGSGKKVIVVMNSGITNDYNDVINNGGLVISEYPFDVKPDSNTSLKRNSIIAGIANKICSIEIHEHSGTLLAINQALALGKEVYCVPNINDISAVNNRLIDEGANALTLGTTL